MRAAPRTTSSSSPTAASAAPSPTTSCRPCAAARPARPPDHIVIETSGLALPKPLVKAFDWPEVRTRVTVDGVVAVVDGAAVATAASPTIPRRSRASARPIPRSTTTARSPSCSRTSSPAPTWWCSTRPTCWRRRTGRWSSAGPAPSCGRACAWSAATHAALRLASCSASARRPRTTSTPGRRITTTARDHDHDDFVSFHLTVPALDDATLRRAARGGDRRHRSCGSRASLARRRQGHAPGGAGRRRSHPALLRPAWRPSEARAGGSW